MAEHTIKPLSKVETAAFCSQLAMILSSGISALEGINLMQEDVQSSDEKAMLSVIETKILETGYLCPALAETKAFPKYMLEMVEIGEQAGRLDDVMRSLAEHYTREDDIQKAIKNAITYPLIMVFMMLAIILVLITKVMPIFNQVFRQLGQEMTGISKAILNFGNAIDRYAVVLVVIIVLLVAGVIYFALSKKGRQQAVSFFNHFGWFRRYHDQVALCRFASGMALTLDSGMTPEDSVAFSAKLIEHPAYEAKLMACVKASEEGEDLFDALLASGIFTGVYARLANIGIRTGTLETAMKQIADQQQEALDTRIANMIAILEPTMVIVLSVIVGLILLSVMLPLVGIMSNL